MIWWVSIVCCGNRNYHPHIQNKVILAPYKEMGGLVRVGLHSQVDLTSQFVSKKFAFSI